tara:strand:- start:228 stop:824 length:597 start_codon:yes stop_codon:yes gene_type:complete
MEKPTDNELVTNVKRKNCEDSLKLLISRHSPLCFDVCKKYSKALIQRGIDVNDISGDKDYMIYKSVMSFDPTKKTKFSTWLGNQMRYHCLNSLNKNRLIPTEDSQMDFFMNRNVEYVKDSVEEQVDYVDNLVSQIKDSRVKKIFSLRYFGNPNKKTPWNKVAKEVGVSTQTAINLHTKAMNMIKRKMTNKNIYANDKI